MTNKIQILHFSPEGRARFAERIERKREEYLRVCKEREVAHELSGDGWHDNPYFNKLQQDEAQLNQELAMMMKQYRTGEIHEFVDGRRPAERVALGAIVEVLEIDEQSGEERVFFWEVVCIGDTDLEKGRVAYNLPLIRPLMGLEVGDDVTWVVDGRTLTHEVLELHQSWPLAASA